MFAAQDGLVDLDAPITTYLPDFHVNSIFEEHPEQKITLRILLSHTAGFAHEASYGSNYDHPSYSFERHIASISDTWLKFPVGTRYSYSNMGIDIAGYILQVRSGIPFVEYVQEKVLNPLGMKNSTLDVKRVRANSTRAIGYTIGNSFRPPVDFLFIPSGGVWTTAADMAHYLQFHINKGALDEDRLLREDLAETMYTPPSAPARNAYPDSSYSLGITVNMRNGARHFQHGGGGFGFNSSMVWYPELKLGAVVLCNVQLSDDFVVQVNDAVLDSIIDNNPTLYIERARDAVRVDPAYPPDKKENILFDYALQRLIENQAVPEEAANGQRQKSLVGKYFLVGSTEMVELSDYNGKLAFSYFGDTGNLTEVRPGLYFSPYGDALDFRGQTPTFANIRLAKVNTQRLPFQILFYATCGLVFLSALFFWPTRLLLHRIRRKSGPMDAAMVRPLRNSWLVGVSVLSALASLFSLPCLMMVALFPILLYMPWLTPYVDLTWWQFTLLSLPFVSLTLAIVIVLLIGLSMRGHVVGHTNRLYYLIVAFALVAFNLAILI
jgi:CubicO group peptidase (beta-lactamase class C family)